MEKCFVFLILCISYALAQDQPQPRSHFGDHKSIHDKEHIKQHLEDKIDTEEVKLDPEKERFHYFSMHDLNKDNLIDGTEIAKAITHSHDEENPNPAVDDEKIEKIVDSVLKNIDSNNDGFIDYMEYVRNQEGD